MLTDHGDPVVAKGDDLAAHCAIARGREHQMRERRQRLAVEPVHERCEPVRAGVADEPDTCVVAADSCGGGKDRRSRELVPKLAGYRHRSGWDATGLDPSPKVALMQVRV